MARKHYTALGESIDMAALAMQNARTVAIGNARMNARGDLVDTQGLIMKTQEQIDQEWQRAREARDASVGTHDIKQPMPFAETARKKLDQDQDFDPAMPVPATTTAAPAARRKITDTNQ
jgi:hypothetical protein